MQNTTRVGVAVVLWQDATRQRLLLGLGHSPDNKASIYAVPGGHVEPGERLVETAQRELQEEAGVSARDLGLISIHEFANRERQRWYVAIGFEGVLESGQPRVMEPDKKSNWGWYAPADALALPLFDPDRVLIERTLAPVLYRL